MQEQELILLQGASGSGKSTTAKQIALEEFGGTRDQGGTCYIFGTDEFFYVPTNPSDPNSPKEYRWDGGLLSRYHTFNQERTRRALLEGFTVIVDNTNLKRWQCIPYVEMAVSRGIPIRYVVCLGEYDNVHGVDAEAVTRMRNGREFLSTKAILSTIPSVRDASHALAPREALWRSCKQET